jgi:NADH dehydrogenase
MFMPFYLPSDKAPKVIIVGGGYAGLSALVALREHSPEAEIVLIDPRDQHLKVTHLHESFRRPLSEFRVSFDLLTKRFDARHIQACLAYEEDSLQQWASDGFLEINGDFIEFDYLIWATGTGSKHQKAIDHCFGLEDFARTSGPEILNRAVEGNSDEDVWLTLVGSGATGIQFLFEISHYIKQRGLDWHLRLVDGADAPLSQFNPKLGKYVVSRLEDTGTDFFPNHYFKAQTSDSIEIENKETGEISQLPSKAAFLFMGMRPEPVINTNVFGQVRLEGKTLPKIFAAGDCSRFNKPGSNSLSAQTALRKGRLVAHNVLRHSSKVKLLEPYIHRDLGYVISMGPNDAVGWLGLPQNIVAGQPATLIKEIVEAQYDLLLAGLDTFVI